MKALRAACTLFGILTLPAIAAAGPIQFQLYPTQITPGPGHPALVPALVPLQPPSPVYTFDPATGLPTVIGVVGYDPALLPTPPPKDVHPDGTTHWNNDGYFRVGISITDLASGESALLQFTGRVHMYNHYSHGHGWDGLNFFWFRDSATVTLGDNEYRVWGLNRYDPESATVGVWVGPNAPVDTPEPGTAALVALGLLPLGLRSLRRRLA